MSDGLKIQGEVSLSTDQSESALNRLGDKAGQMAINMSEAGAKAGKAVDQIGEIAKSNGEKFTKSESVIVASLKRLAAEAAQAKSVTEGLGKIDFSIAAKGLDAEKFRPMIDVVKQLQNEYKSLGVVQNSISGSSKSFGSSLQNTSYQLQDFIVQVNGGTDATKALGQQLPQMLVGFGAAGAAIGVVAAMLPNLISAFSDSAAGAKKFSDAMSDFDKAIGDVGSATKEFDMENLYEEFNKSSSAVRAATIEQVKFQQEYIKTTQLVAGKKFGESLSGLGDYSTLDKFAGAFGSSGAEKLSKQLGVTLETAKDLMPVLAGLRNGSEDVSLAFNKFGSTLLGGNQKAVELATTMSSLAKSERDAAAASSSLSDAQAKMAKGHVTTKKELDEAAKSAKSSAKELDAISNLLDSINGKSSGFDQNYVKNVETLLVAYDKGKISLNQFNDAFTRYASMQPGAIAAAKELEKAQDDYYKALYAGSVELDRRADKLEQEVEFYGMTASAIERVNIARLEEARAIADVNGAYPEHLAYLDREIEARKRIASASAQKEYIDANREATKSAAREWEKFADDINRSLTDSLFRAFESGESFGESFVKSLQNTLKTTLLKLGINVVTSTGGSVLNAGINAVVGTSGSNGGSGENYFGLASNANSAYNLYNGTYLGYATSAYNYGSTALGYTYGTNALSQQSLMLAAQDGGMSVGAGSAASSGAAAEGGASMAGLGYAAGYMAIMYAVFELLTTSKSRYLDTTISGAMGENGFSGTMTDRYKNTGNLINDGSIDSSTRLLSGDKAEISEFLKQQAGEVSAETLRMAGYLTPSANRPFDSIEGDYYSQEDIDAARKKYLDAVGSGANPWDVQGSYDQVSFSSNADYSKVLDEQATTGGLIKSAIESIYGATKESLDGVAAQFDDSTVMDKLESFSKEINIQFGGSIVDGLKTFGDALYSEMGNVVFPSIEALKQSSESWSDAFGRIVNESSAVSNVFELMGKTLSEVFGKDNADGILKASDNIVTLFGSIDALNASFSSYYANFYSQAEQSAKGWEDMAKAFEYIGREMPTTREGFKALVDSLDLSNVDYQSTFKALMDVQGAFAALTPTIQDFAASASAVNEVQATQIGKYLDAQREIQSNLIQDQISAAQIAAESASEMADTFKGIVNSLSEYQSTLLSGQGEGLSPEAKYAEARRAYDAAVNKAKLGDAEASLDLPGLADAFLAASLAVGSAESYARDLGGVSGTIDAVIEVAERQVPIAESQLKVAQDQLETLNELLAKATGDQSPIVVSDFAQAAKDWTSFFSTTAVGDVVTTAAGTMQRISESMGMYIDKAGTGYTFSSGDTPYTLAGASSEFREWMLEKYGKWSVPAFASGGYHSGGLRLVGENGPELEVTGPSSIINASDTLAIAGSGEKLIAELQALRAEVTTLREEQRAGNAAIANNTGRAARNLEKFDIDGMPEVRAA